MKSFLIIAQWALVGVSSVNAFPSLPPTHSNGVMPSKVKRQNPSAIPPFDAESQYVSTSGLHEWKAPGPRDMRGPCPGLNALANHGYISRTGLVTIPEFIVGCRTVFGMDEELATILAAYGAVLDGQGVSWSIAGGPHIGIGGSHNNYETDSSPLRGDLNQYGSNTDLVMSQFHELYNMQPDAESANYDLSVLRDFREKRFNESIAGNPDFFYAPFSGPAVSQAAFSFIYRFMANKSAEYPTGRLDKNVLKSFMSISGPEDNLTWTPGHERIPEDWYNRNEADLYGLSYLSDDIDYLTARDTRMRRAGCNQGKVNSYVPINTTALSGSTYTQAEIIANPLCYGLAYALAQTGFLGVVSSVVGEFILPIQNAFGCKTIPSLNMSVAQACSGYSLYGGPTTEKVLGVL